MLKSMWDRFWFLVQAQLNKFLEKQEDPVKMALGVKAQLQLELSKARVQYGNMVPDVQDAQKAADINAQNVLKWQERIDLRTVANDSAGAAECLDQKEACESKQPALDADLAQKKANQEHFQNSINELERKLKEVEGILTEMRTNTADAAAMTTSAQAAKAIGGDLERLRNKVQKEEDVAETRAEITS